MGVGWGECVCVRVRVVGLGGGIFVFIFVLFFSIVYSVYYFDICCKFIRGYDVCNSIKLVL